MQINNSFSNFIHPAYLAILIPPALVTGPFFPDLFLSLISIFFLSYTIIKKKINYYKNVFVYIFIIFYLYLLINTYNSDYPYFSFRSSFFYLRYLFFTLGIIYFLNNYPNFIKYFFYSISITFIVVLFDGYIQWYLCYNIFGWKPEFAHRITGMFGNESILGSYIARLTPLLFALFFFIKPKLNLKIVIFLLAILLVLNLLILRSGERSAFFFTILFDCFFLLILIKEYKKYILYFCFFLFISLYLSINFSNHIKHRMIDVSIEHLTEKKFIKYGPYSAHHEGHYIEALKIFKQNPIIGSGVNSFRKICIDPQICSTHPHNTYIQLLAETGIIGFILILTIFILISLLILKKYIQIFKDKVDDNLIYYKLFLLISMFISLFPFLPTGNFFNNWINIIYYLPVGFYLWQNKKIRINE